MKKVAVLGGGISGVFAAILIKEKHRDYEVTIFEHNDKLLKKVYATGNGKCNFANIGELKDKYSHEEFALPILNNFNAQDVIKYFSTIGVKSKTIGDLVYPYSESAETVATHLLKKVDELNINVCLSSHVKDYQNGQLLTDNGAFSYDALIISIGGKSSPQLGSNGNFFDVLLKHGYRFSELSPSLCPIKVKENTKMVDGYRSKVTAYLYNKNQLIHEESGELLFKKDGLSGMVILNLAHYINRLADKKDVKIKLDLAKGEDGDYDTLVHPKIAKYLLYNKLDIHNLTYTFKDFYGFDNSHVTSGGIQISEVDTNLLSKREKNVYFTGEVLDVDGVCGGFNIMWALASAKRVSENI